MSDMECPHCGAEWDDDAGEWASAGIEPPNPYDAECPECEEPISVHVEWDPVFYVSKR